jgi:glutathione-independent formaldehyde dehydrogenase
MADTNQGVVYTGPGRVEVQDLDYPKLELPEQNNRPLQHGVILRVVATNICGSDQHMVRGRTTAPEGQTLGHEITGEVAEVGRDVEYIKQGDLVSVPFNIACGRCRNCKERNTGVCENVNRVPAALRGGRRGQAAAGARLPADLLRGARGAHRRAARLDGRSLGQRP